MPEDNKQSVSDLLSRVEHFAGLDPHRLAALAEQADIIEAAAGTVLLDLGSEDPRLLFLLDGRLELVAADGATRRVAPGDPAAMGPISRLRPSRYRVSARTPAICMMIEQQALEHLIEQSPSSGVVVEEALLGGEPSELLDDNATHPVMYDVFADFNHGRIVVPSDPDVAIRVGRSLRGVSHDAVRLAGALSACPALTLKVLRAAMQQNDGRAPVRSVSTAVARLGLDSAHDLAIQCVLRESLRSRSLVVRQRMHAWWERTLRVAAICSVLARMQTGLSPEYANLVGLLHSIAEPVLLGYADRHPDLAEPTTLDNIVHDNRAQLGRLLTMLWGLPREVVEATTMCNYWSYDHPGAANYTDVMLVAQWHAMIGGTAKRRMPGIDEIPAFRRLGLDGQSPEVSLKIVETANSAIEEADSLLCA